MKTHCEICRKKFRSRVFTVAHYPMAYTGKRRITHGILKKACIDCKRKIQLRVFPDYKIVGRTHIVSPAELERRRERRINQAE